MGATKWLLPPECLRAGQAVQVARLLHRFCSLRDRCHRMQQEHESRVLIAEAALHRAPVALERQNRDYLQKGHGQQRMVPLATGSVDDGPRLSSMLHEGLKDKDCKVQWLAFPGGRAYYAQGKYLLCS